MTWVAAAIGGGAVLGYLGSQNAADAQIASAQQSADVQRQMFDKQVELQAPFRTAGLAAQNRLLTLLGIDPNPDVSMGGGGMLGGFTIPGEVVGTPGVSVDQNSPDFGRYSRDFGMSDFQQDPGYQFRMSEGLKALDRQAAARGGLISGSALKAAQRYGQDAASQEYQNAFNRYQVNRTNQLNPLQSLAGVGQTSANTLGSAAGQLGQGLGETYLGAGNARAAGMVGGANAVSGGIGQYLNYSQGNNLINALRGGGSAAPSNAANYYSSDYGQFF